MGIGGFLGQQLGFLVFQLHLAEKTNGYRGQDNANHTKGVGTGVAGGYLGNITRENGSHRLRGGTQSGGVGHSTIKGTYQHGQVVGIRSVKKQIVATEHHGDVQQYRGGGQTVQRHTVLTETLKETGTYLQTDHEHKQYQTKVLTEIQNGLRGRKMNVTGHNAGKQHKCHP